MIKKDKITLALAIKPVIIAITPELETHPLVGEGSGGITTTISRKEKTMIDFESSPHGNPFIDQMFGELGYPQDPLPPAEDE